MYLRVLPACMYVHHMHAWYLQRSEEVLKSPGTEAAMLELGPKPRSSARWQVLLITEPSPQSLLSFLGIR